MAGVTFTTDAAKRTRNAVQRVESDDGNRTGRRRTLFGGLRRSLDSVSSEKRDSDSKNEETPEKVVRKYKNKNGSYLPGGGKYFGCRHCYDLTYTSCQESHKYDACLSAVGAPMGLSAREVGKLLKQAKW